MYIKLSGSLIFCKTFFKFALRQFKVYFEPFIFVRKLFQSFLMWYQRNQKPLQYPAYSNKFLRTFHKFTGSWAFYNCRLLYTLYIWLRSLFGQCEVSLENVYLSGIRKWSFHCFESFRGALCCRYPKYQLEIAVQRHQATFLR